MNSEIPLIQAWIDSKRDEQANLRIPKKRNPVTLKSKSRQAENAILICQAERMIIEKMNA